MYNIQNAITLLKNPSGIPGVIHELGTAVNQRYYEWRGGPDGVSIMEEDWDNLFLLDGCRYDLFEETVDLDGNLESRISPGSSSSDFIRSTFDGTQYHDTVYVTANPYFFMIPDGTFHATKNVLEDGWDQDVATVPPKVMADAVREANHKYPNKRLLVHFMQPHYPFIGEKGKQIEQGGIGPQNNNGEDPSGEGDIWVKLQFRLTDASHDDVWDAYRENLELVLVEIRDLLDDIDGRTVLSSDHGNLVGDQIGPIPTRGYGHPPSLYVDKLVKIPWFKIPGQRRQVVSDLPVGTQDIAEDIVNDRLEQLGYKAT